MNMSALNTILFKLLVKTDLLLATVPQPFTAESRKATAEMQLNRCQT